jgi:hypothetical protein
VLLYHLSGARRPRHVRGKRAADVGCAVDRSNVRQVRQRDANASVLDLDAGRWHSMTFGGGDMAPGLGAT